MTSSPNEKLERIARRVPVPEPAYERLLRRRDRNRRNQRIAAGIVGIAVFVASIGIVTTFGSSDRTQPGASGGALTGPTVTGPTVTGPTAPALTPPDTGWNGRGLPPEGTALSAPVKGELVALYDPVLAPNLVYVYADGRVLTRARPQWESMLERRLTPEGVQLVRSGSVAPSEFLHGPASLPADAWADAEARRFAPPRYAICGLGPAQLGTLPPRAEALLRGTEPFEGDYFGLTAPCLRALTTEQARALDGILSDAGFERDVEGSGASANVALVFVPTDWPGKAIAITFVGFLPHGELVPDDKPG